MTIILVLVYNEKYYSVTQISSFKAFQCSVCYDFSVQPTLYLNFVVYKVI